jgi:hypothetical protein
LYVEQLVNGISRTYSSSFLASKIKTWRWDWSLSFPHFHFFFLTTYFQPADHGQTGSAIGGHRGCRIKSLHVPRIYFFWELTEIG